MYLREEYLLFKFFCKGSVVSAASKLSAIFSKSESDFKIISGFDDDVLSERNIFRIKKYICFWKKPKIISCDFFFSHRLDNLSIDNFVSYYFYRSNIKNRSAKKISQQGQNY